MPVANINEVEIYYEIHGDGLPLLLIAGLASDSQSWMPVVPALSENFKVIIFDNRGVGRSKPSEPEISISKMADDCAALIRFLGLSSVNIIGHSMGGFVALDFALRYPQLLGKLILEATSSFSSNRNIMLFSDWAAYLEKGMDSLLWWKNIFYWIFHPDFFENEQHLISALRYCVDYPYPQSKISFRRQVNAIFDFNCSTKLSKIKNETQIICGKNDLIFSPEESVGSLRTIPGKEIVIVENSAHSIHLDNSREFVRCVLDFLLN